ncbi:MAG: sodium:proton antiporter [Planctomycetota bacterium]|nr:sodium:proton antiporter [Planctomycetota bacterium]MDA0934880.1 sodium:proton antiporter [Planctomycetota bacterium]MDA1222151.1 sodium:proton antiporter [Planctomycetota bacterium]
MFVLDAAAVLLVLAAVFGLLNHHVFRLPFAIGMLVSGLLASIGVLVVDPLLPEVHLAESVRGAVLQVDFADAVLNGMLSLLLFAGALHTDLALLRTRLAAILSLATFGVVISTAVAGGAAWFAFGLAGLDVEFGWCLVFGALISPTDPIAVLGIMKAAKAPKDLEIKVIGESLLNDGVGVVLFVVLIGLATAGGHSPTAPHVALVLAHEVLGGLLLGLLAGWACCRAVRSLDEPNLEVLMTLALVMGIGFAAPRLHVSAPLAAVAAGLLIGNSGREHALGDRTELVLDTVWTFLDETLNALLFLLIGIEVLAIDFSHRDYLLAALILVPLVLLARLAGVALPLAALGRRAALGPGAIPVLTWGGLKGGISIALAMKTPDFPGREAVLTATYTVVIFSILVQGLTVGPLIRRVARTQEL